jgi:hypothetical protein
MMKQCVFMVCRRAFLSFHLFADVIMIDIYLFIVCSSGRLPIVLCPPESIIVCAPLLVTPNLIADDSQTSAHLISWQGIDSDFLPCEVCLSSG